MPQAILVAEAVAEPLPRALSAAAARMPAPAVAHAAVGKRYFTTSIVLASEMRVTDGTEAGTVTLREVGSPLSENLLVHVLDQAELRPSAQRPR